MFNKIGKKKKWKVNKKAPSGHRHEENIGIKELSFMYLFINKTRLYERNKLA